MFYAPTIEVVTLEQERGNGMAPYDAETHHVKTVVGIDPLIIQDVPGEHGSKLAIVRVRTKNGREIDMKHVTYRFGNSYRGPGLKQYDTVYVFGSNAIEMFRIVSDALSNAGYDVLPSGMNYRPKR